jgi:hypothetical protein
MPLRHRAAIVGDGHQHGLAVQIVEYSMLDGEVLQRAIIRAALK